MGWGRFDIYLNHFPVFVMSAEPEPIQTEANGSGAGAGRRGALAIERVQDPAMRKPGAMAGLCGVDLAGGVNTDGREIRHGRIRIFRRVTGGWGFLDPV